MGTCHAFEGKGLVEFLHFIQMLLGQLQRTARIEQRKLRVIQHGIHP